MEQLTNKKMEILMDRMMEHSKVCKLEQLKDRMMVGLKV